MDPFLRRRTYLISGYRGEMGVDIELFRNYIMLEVGASSNLPHVPPEDSENRGPKYRTPIQDVNFS